MPPAKPMTKAKIVTELAEKNEVTKKQATEFLDSLVELAYKEAKKGFTIPGLGKLVVQQRKARTGRNPQTGETIKISLLQIQDFFFPVKI